MGHKHHSRPFHVAALDLRGMTVRLDDVVDAIIRGHGYPDPVAKLLAEAVVLTVLLANNMKHQAKFQLQTKTDGAVSMLVVDINVHGHVRAYARHDEERLALYGAKPSSKALLGKGYMGLTIEPEDGQNRYQGIVEISGNGLEEAAQNYFNQSEQIPTVVKLAATSPEPTIDLDRARWRAGGILGQSLPPPSPFKDPESAEARKWQDEIDDHWREAEARLGTVEADELLDPALSSEALLLRLFDPHDIRVSDVRPFEAKCRCNPERIMDMLKSFDTKDVADMAQTDGMIAVTCEFCSKEYKTPLATIVADSVVGHA